MLISPGEELLPSFNTFLIVSTCLLYLVAAGLFSRGVWYLQAQAWNKEVGADADEVGSGPGSYDITKSVWHVNVRHLSPSPPSLQFPLVTVLTSHSSATQSSTEAAAGESSTLSSAGKTPPPTAPSSPTTCTGSLSSWASWL